MYAFIVTTSTIPLKSSAEPIGSVRGTIPAPKISFASSNTLPKFALSLSILLITTNRGRFRSSDAAHTSSVPTSTPETESSTTMPASATRMPSLVSPMKSAYPGVSRRFIFLSFHSSGSTDSLMEIWREISSSSKSDVVFPSETLPILLMAPAVKSMASESVVLPELPCPKSTMLWILSLL